MYISPIISISVLNRVSVNTPPHLVSGIFVGVTHNSELSTEHMLPSSLSTSSHVLSPVTTSTGLVHALHYSFIIFVLSYSIPLLDVRPEAPVHNWYVSAYLCRDCVRHYCLLYTFINRFQPVNYMHNVSEILPLDCHMHATHTVHLTQYVCSLNVSR